MDYQDCKYKIICKYEKEKVCIKNCYIKTYFDGHLKPEILSKLEKIVWNQLVKEK